MKCEVRNSAFKVQSSKFSVLIKGQGIGDKFVKSPRLGVHLRLFLEFNGNRRLTQMNPRVSAVNIGLNEKPQMNGDRSACICVFRLYSLKRGRGTFRQKSIESCC